MRQGGRLPAIEDVRLPLMAARMPFASLPSPKQNVNWYAAVGEWPMLMNDVRGDCVEAAAGHFVQQVTTYQMAPRIMSDGEADTTYQSITGWTPTINDEVGPGTYVLGQNGLIQRWRTTGLMIGGALHHCGPVARVNIQDENEMAQAIDVFGAMLVGIRLTRNVYNAEFLVDDAGGDLVSLHEWLINGYETLASGYRVYDVVSWGAHMRCTAPVLRQIIDEAIVIIDTDDMASRGHDPVDVPLSELESEMAANFQAV